MTPLDATRALLADRPILGGSRLKSAPNGRCYYCAENWRDEPHAPDCPILALPQIVAVMEAAEALVSVWQEMAARRARRVAAPWAEVALLPRACNLLDAERAARHAFVAALTEVA